MSTTTQPPLSGSSPSPLLGSSGFIFLDDRPWPYLVSDHSGEWWLHYWSDGYKRFATMRKLTLDEVERFRPHAMPPEQAALYLPNETSAGTDASAPRS